MKAIRELEPMIRESQFDVIIGLAEGLLVASIIALNLRIGKLYFIDAPYTYDSNGTRVITLIGNLPRLDGKRCLLVDNHVYSGANLAAAVAMVRAQNPMFLKTLVLFKHDSIAPNVAPDFFAEQYSGRIVKVPWSFTAEHKQAYRQ